MHRLAHLYDPYIIPLYFLSGFSHNALLICALFEMVIDHEYIAVHCTDNQVEYHPNVLIIRGVKNYLPSNRPVNTHLQRLGYQRSNSDSPSDSNLPIT